MRERDQRRHIHPRCLWPKLDSNLESYDHWKIRRDSIELPVFSEAELSLMGDEKVIRLFPKGGMPIEHRVARNMTPKEYIHYVEKGWFYTGCRVVTNDTGSAVVGIINRED